ncbi:MULTISPECIES: aminoglycoside phosphotransferase family protein [Corynebacterium]|uniref:aminoglycoside phosphotransferase family protein n=1 Tax=Corynebacterium TaxID=1716 RepID=UPI001D167D19|nr:MULTISPECIES: aminoglycoside phosphotransferase family protein [Corynebacterium]
MTSQHQPEVGSHGLHVHPDTLADLVSRTWRDLTWESVSVPDQGMDHAVVKLHGVSSHEGELADMIPETVVIRVPYAEDYRVQAPLESAVVAQLSKLRFAAVRAVNSAADALGDGQRGSGGLGHGQEGDPHKLNAVRVPGTVRQSYVRGTFGTDQPLMLTMQTNVHGEPMTRQVWDEMSAEDRAWAATQLGSMLAGLRSLDPDLVPVRNVESWWTDGEKTSQLNTSARSLPGKLALMKRRAPVYLEPNLSASEMATVREIFAEVESLIRRPYQQRCLTHGELIPDHVLWSPTDGVGVIDFSDMTIGDPALDYAHLADIAPEFPGMVYEEALKAGAPHHEAEPPLLERAQAFKRWDNVFLLIDHYRTGHSPRVELE